MKTLPSKNLHRLPLDHLHDKEGAFGTRLRALSFEELRAIMQAEPSVAVASLGAPLRWISRSDLPRFWQRALPNIATVDDDGGFSLDDYPGHFAYAASEWRGRSGERIVLLETYH